MYKGPKTTMYIVRSLNMVNWLCSHGFKILKVEIRSVRFMQVESPQVHSCHTTVD